MTAQLFKNGSPEATRARLPALNVDFSSPLLSIRLFISESHRKNDVEIGAVY
jgi:hypothetical protein